MAEHAYEDGGGEQAGAAMDTAGSAVRDTAGTAEAAMTEHAKAPRVPNHPLTEATQPVPDVPAATEPETPQSVGATERYHGSPAAGGVGLDNEPIPAETDPDED
ncbi:hypothetical protein ACQP00_30270 [Dactylosporangium sp. CS-047395]|uniref:hypothetical protein n=1 Tax=Dactylosporangium sp. CS-047395 TaxID=3239936 RepID=UPI003D8A227C